MDGAVRPRLHGAVLCCPAGGAVEPLFRRALPCRAYGAGDG